MRGDYQQYYIQADMTVEEALRIIDQGGRKTAFLVDNGKLKGTVTDGDVRRFLLQGGDIRDSVQAIINYTPKFAYEDNNLLHYKQYMIDNFISALPILDREHNVVRIEFLNPVVRTESRQLNLPVVIMAGGIGARLKPYTDIIPKPLIPIGEKTISERIMERFQAYGCSQIYMVVNYKKRLIQAYFKENQQYSDLCFVEEPFFMGTAGGIQLLKEKLQEDFFLVNCDILIDYDFYQVWDAHVKNQNIITMVCARKQVLFPYGTVISDETDRVLSLEEKPSWTYDVNTGMYLCSSKIFNYIEKSEKIDMTDLIDRCIQAGERVGQFKIDESEWYDMGQLDGLDRMRQHLGIGIDERYRI